MTPNSQGDISIYSTPMTEMHPSEPQELDRVCTVGSLPVRENLSNTRKLNGPNWKNSYEFNNFEAIFNPDRGSSRLHGTWIKFRCGFSFMYVIS